MAVLPAVNRPKGKMKLTNLLFFGHFAWLDEQEWTDELLCRMETDEQVFRTIAHDIYQNGQVLYRRKYRFLAYAYRLFIAGLCVTLAVFAFEWFKGAL